MLSIHFMLNGFPYTSAVNSRSVALPLRTTVNLAFCAKEVCPCIFKSTSNTKLVEFIVFLIGNANLAKSAKSVYAASSTDRVPCCVPEELIFTYKFTLLFCMDKSYSPKAASSSPLRTASKRKPPLPTTSVNLLCATCKLWIL